MIRKTLCLSCVLALGALGREVFVALAGGPVARLDVTTA